jgi:ribose transport system substrate-binding protein
MKNKTLLSVAASALMIGALLAGCAAPAAAPAAPAEPAATEAATEAAAEAPAEAAAKPYIPIISKGFQHQFWQAVKLGAENGAAEFDVDKQIEMLAAALAKDPAAICFAALDSKAAVPLLEEAAAKGIPVIGFDSGVDSDIPVTTAATDNIAAAAYAADKMAEAIGGAGEVAVIVHDQTSRTGIDRRDGFVNRMAEAYPDITVVDVQYGGGDQLKSTDLAKAIIQANPNLKGFFGANEGSIIGVLNAVTELGMEGKLTIIGYDAGKQQKDAVRSGLMLGSVSQDPVGIGYKCVESAVKALAGEELPTVTDTGFKWYDATNIDSEEMAPLLYD